MVPGHSYDVVVAGSFKRENLPYLRATISRLVLDGARVVAPASVETDNPDRPFVLLATDDPGSSARQLETAFMDAITEADLLVVVNHNPRQLGRIGLSAACEMAWARICGVPFQTTAETIFNISRADSMFFADEVTPEEAEALHEASRHNITAPLPQGDANYNILLNMRNRLIDSLPDSAENY